MPLQKCCFCVDLRIGSLVIGYLYLISSFLLFFLSLTLLVLGIIGLAHISSQSTYVIALVLLGLDMLLTAISFIFTIVLLYGIHKNDYKYIRPYLIYNTAHLFLHVINFGLSFLFLLTIIDIVSNLLSIVLTAYLLLVIWSYWLHLKAKETQFQSVDLPAQTDDSVPAVHPELPKEGHQVV